MHPRPTIRCLSGLFLLGLTLVSPKLPAQTLPPLFQSGCRAHLPPTPFTTMAMVVRDLNGDGRPDLVTANRTRQQGPGEPNRLYLNTGNRTFGEAPPGFLPLAWDEVNDLACGDLDGDGNPDLVVANNGRDQVLLGDGKGRFTDVTHTALPYSSRSHNTLRVRLMDLDRDGDLDLVALCGPVQTSSQSNRILVNNGKGVFTPSTLYLPRFTNLVGAGGAVAGDFNGDGILDLLVLHVWQAILLAGDGKGALYQTSTFNFSSTPSCSQVTTVTAGDLDGDGDLDLVVNPGKPILVENNGKGLLTVSTRFSMTTPSGCVTDVTLFDHDGDGDLDLLALVQGDAAELLLNDGKGRFAPAPTGTITPPIHLARRAVPADLDGDGDRDLVIAHHEGIRLYGRTRSGGYVGLGGPAWDPQGDRVTLDADGDGDLDILEVSNTDKRIRLLANDGAGRFEPAPPGNTPAFSNPAMALTFGPFLDTPISQVADLDGDGDPDVIVSTGASLPRLLFNQGGLVFKDLTASRWKATPTGSWQDYRSFAAGDLDGDGDLDLVTGSIGMMSALPGPNRIHFNDGKGTFTEASITLPFDYAYRWILHDLDGDGACEVIRHGMAVMVFQNDGKGGLTDATLQRLPPDFHLTSYPTNWTGFNSFHLADLNGDGRVDVIAGGYAAQWGTIRLPALRILFNDGKGVFRKPPAGSIPSLPDPSLTALPADVNGDGHTDIVVPTWPVRYLLNDGKGRFTAIQTRDNLDRCRFAGDLDGDGDDDLLGPGTLHWNLARQASVPHLPSLGGTLVTRFWSHPGSQGLSAGVLPLVGMAGNPLPLPGLGRLLLDPARPILALPAMWTSRHTGWVDLAIPLPNSTALVGSRVAMQGLLTVGAPASTRWHLTNALTTTLRRF